MAFGLGFFCAIDVCGIDRFYLGYTGIGIARLLLGFCWIPLVALASISLCFVITSEKFIAAHMCSKYLAIVSLVATAIWCIIDLILIVSGNLSDSNGYSLN
jgi:hypothetical protein